MNANELMIGDWVYCTYWPKPHIVRVAELRTVADDELKVKVYDDDIPLIFDGEFIQPISLTAEILEKNGFEKICLKSGQVVYSLADDYYDLEAEEITDSIWRIEYFNVEASFPSCRELVSFVHEIQHFLNSHKIEKEIEL